VLSDLHGAALFNPNGVTGYDCIDRDLVVCTNTGMQESNKEYTTLSVYPIPARDNINVILPGNNTGIVVCEMYDAMGRMVKRIEAKTDGGSLALSIGRLVPGIYQLRMTGSDTSANATVIIE
jgi:hypothetical protein